MQPSRAGGLAGQSMAVQGTNQIYLIGTKKALLLDVYRPQLEVFDSAPPWTPPPVNPRDPMGFWRTTQEEVGTQPKRALVPLPVGEGRSDESHFVDCILEDRESEIECASSGPANRDFGCWLSISRNGRCGFFAPITRLITRSFVQK